MKVVTPFVALILVIYLLPSFICTDEGSIRGHYRKGENEQRQHWKRVVKLNVYKNQFVRVYMGNPASMKTFLLDKNCMEDDSAFILNSIPSSHSKTYEARETFTRDLEYLYMQEGIKTSIEDLDTFGVGDRVEDLLSSLEQREIAAEEQGQMIIRGSEIFYLGETLIRLPVAYGYRSYLGFNEDTAKAYDEMVRQDGVMCIGPNSYLWRYWSKYTLSSSELTLGAYDTTASSSVSNGKLGMNGNDMIHCTERGNANEQSPKEDCLFEAILLPQEDSEHQEPSRYNVTLSLNRMMNLIPPSLFPRVLRMTEYKYREGKTYYNIEEECDKMYFFPVSGHDIAKNKDTMRHFTVRRQDLLLSSGGLSRVRKSYIQMNKRSEDANHTSTIHLGYGPSLGIVFFYDAIKDQRYISHSYDSFDYGSDRDRFEIVCTLLVSLVLLFWLCSVIDVDRGYYPLEMVQNEIVPHDRQKVRSINDMASELALVREKIANTNKETNEERDDVRRSRHALAKRYLYSEVLLEMVAFTCSLLVCIERHVTLDPRRYFYHHLYSFKSEILNSLSGHSIEEMKHYDNGNSLTDQYNALIAIIVVMSTVGLIFSVASLLRVVFARYMHQRVEGTERKGEHISHSIWSGIARSLIDAWMSKFSVRRAFVESSLFLTFWFCQVSTDISIYEYLFYTFTMALYCITRLIALLSSLLVRVSTCLEEVLILGALATLSLIAFYCWVAEPYVDRFHFSVTDRGENIFLWIAIWIAIPCLLSFSYVALVNAEHFLNSLKALSNSLQEEDGKK